MVLKSFQLDNIDLSVKRDETGRLVINFNAQCVVN